MFLNILWNISKEKRSYFKSSRGCLTLFCLIENSVNKYKWMHPKYLLYWVFKDTSAIVWLLLVSINKVVFFSHVLLKAFFQSVNKGVFQMVYILYFKASYCLAQTIGGSKVTIHPSSFCCLGLAKDCRQSHSPDLSSPHCARLTTWRWQTFLVPIREGGRPLKKKDMWEDKVQPEKYGCMCEWRQW